MEDREPKRLKDSAENSNPTDDDEDIRELQRLIEDADRLEDCLKCMKCNAILDAIRKISLDARNELVLIDPQKINEVMRLQQTAKLFDSIELVIRNTINRGQLALDQISPQEE